MAKTNYTLVTRKTDTLALDAMTGERIGSFDRTAGASRGTIRGRIVSREFSGWVAELDAM